MKVIEMHGTNCMEYSMSHGRFFIDKVMEIVVFSGIKGALFIIIIKLIELNS